MGNKGGKSGRAEVGEISGMEEGSCFDEGIWLFFSVQLLDDLQD
jgi:hypothetical protein